MYAPIAARLNLYPLKRELYHLALSFLYPKKSKKILHVMRDLRKLPAVTSLEASLSKILAASGLTADIRHESKASETTTTRSKGSWIRGYPENYVDFAIILHSGELTDCYKMLGLVNNNLTAIPRSLRDFIANPKPNGYRSLHTRVHLGGNNYLVKSYGPLEMENWARGESSPLAGLQDTSARSLNGLR